MKQTKDHLNRIEKKNYSITVGGVQAQNNAHQRSSKLGDFLVLPDSPEFK